MPALTWLCRITLALGLLTAAGGAYALDGEQSVPRLASFGGACDHCDLAGRKLTGAKFLACKFAGAHLAGADLRLSLIHI